MLAIWQGYWIASGRAADFGVFMAHDLETGAASFYFTPSATPLAIKFGAERCSRPVKVPNLQFLLGDDRAVQLLPDFRRDS